MVIKVAIITGGGSGMGLGVATELCRGGWVVNIMDVNEKMGTDAVSQLGSAAKFFKADVTDYADQLKAFEAVFELYGHIDFVFANAGIAGKADFYERGGDLEAPSTLVVDICLTGVIYSSHVAINYMRRNQPPGGVIITTASAASIYATPDLPLYAAAKHGVLGLTRSMSEKLAPEGIRINSILPGAIRTTLHNEDTWSQFPSENFTPVEEVVNTVMGLINDETATGCALEISKGEVFDRQQPEFCNHTMRKIMTDTEY